VNHSIDQTSNLNQYNRVKRLFLSQRPRGGEGLHACRELREPSRRPGLPMDPRSEAGMTSERGQRPACRWPRGGVTSEKGHGSAPAPYDGSEAGAVPPSVPCRGHLPLKGGEGRVWRCPHSRIMRCSRRSAAAPRSGRHPGQASRDPGPIRSQSGGDRSAGGGLSYRPTDREDLHTCRDRLRPIHPPGLPMDPGSSPG
jgi:hypothetical protein